jgi:hypothetical protein
MGHEGFEPPASTSQSENWFRVLLVVLGGLQTRSCLDYEPETVLELETVRDGLNWTARIKEGER